MKKDTQTKDNVKTEQRCDHKPRNADIHQKTEEARNGFSFRTS